MERNTVLVRNFKEYVGLWEKYKSQTPFNIIFREIRCKYCGSSHIIKYGYLKNKQCWWCKECQRKFTNSKPLPGMKISFEAMRTALRMFFKGIPLQTIRMQLEDEYNLSPNRATILKWMERVTLEIRNVDKSVHPEVGDTWIIFETPLTIGKKQYRILDVLDTRTMFLLATKLSHKHQKKDFRGLLETAKEKASRVPDTILNNSSMDYPEEMELIFGPDVKITHTGDSPGNGLKISGNWYIPFKERTAVLSGHREALTHTILEGWRTQYNYYRNHKVLGGKTPGQRAGVSFQYSHGRFETIP
jgi:transposase-like protein